MTLNYLKCEQDAGSLNRSRKNHYRELTNRPPGSLLFPLSKRIPDIIPQVLISKRCPGAGLQPGPL